MAMNTISAYYDHLQNWTSKTSAQLGSRLVTLLSDPLTSKTFVQNSHYLSYALLASAATTVLLVSYILLRKHPPAPAPTPVILVSPPVEPEPPPPAPPPAPFQIESIAAQLARPASPPPVPFLAPEPIAVEVPVEAPPPPPPSIGDRIVLGARRAVVNVRDPTKWFKYRYTLRTMKESTQDLPLNTNEELVRTLTHPEQYPTADDQYRAFVLQLREDAVSYPSPLVSRLAYERFAGVKLYSYCRDLIHDITGELPSDLTLDTFETELRERNKKLDNLPVEKSMPSIVRVWNKLKGWINVWFDPTLNSNLPFWACSFTWAGRAVKVLRHGVPVIHHNVGGVVAFLVGWIPFVGRIVTGYIPPKPPQITPDYIAFIEEAGRRDENILHVCFENGKKASIGDESSRVEARMSLVRYNNFFPLALRLDGDFYKPRNFQPETIEGLKRAFKEQLAGTLDTTGFSIPPKCNLTPGKIDELLNEVEALYFPHPTIESLPYHQSFILFSYAHIVLYLCKSLNISILEAFCKDDIDRGNAFKAILTLHTLYLTGEINSENLTRVLVNTLAPPAIVKKQGIIASREMYIYQALQILRDAYNLSPRPQIRAIADIQEQFSYDVHETDNYGFLFLGSAAGTWAEYQEFLDQKVWSLPEPQDLRGEQNKETIRSWIAERRVDADRLRAYLTQQGMTEDEAWKVMGYLPNARDQTIDRLKRLFGNESLRFSIDEFDPTFRFTVIEGKTEVTSNYKIIDRDLRTKGDIQSTAIIDHREGSVQFEFSLLS